MAEKILIVDDELQVIKALKRTLQDEPYDIVSALSAVEALEVLREDSFDVIISDEKMPGMTGGELLAEVCREYPDTVRILLTGQPSLEAITRAINQGEIFRFLSKPWDDTDLILTIQQAIQRKKLLNQNPEALKQVRKQSDAIRELESAVPGITKLKKDADGAIIIDESDDIDDLDDYLNSFSIKEE